MRTQIATTLGIAAFLLAGCDTTSQSTTGDTIQDFLNDTRGKVVAWYRYDALIGYDYIDPVDDTVISQELNGRCINGRIEIRDQNICYIIDDKTSNFNDAYACYEALKTDGKYQLNLTSSSFETYGIPLLLTAKPTNVKKLECK